MSNMQSLKNTAGRAANTAAKAAKHVAFISRCRMEILAEKEKIRRNYAKIGKVYYKDYVTDEEPDEAEYKPLCDSITYSYQVINRLREAIADAKAAYSVQASLMEEEEVLIPLEEETE